MAWTPEFPDLEDAQERARKAMAMPIGMASPLWLAFGAAASAGVAWWWMTRWTRASNLEAMTGAAKAQVAAVEALVERESEVALKAVEAAASMLEAAQVIGAHVEIIAEAAPETGEPQTEAYVEVFVEAAPVAQTGPDDLTQLTGVGPKLAAALAARGILTFAQLADWTEEQAQAFDAELSLKGRVARDAWIAQARRLASA
ncbi:MAG TPA: helix-hairpin-helix domain-containing protein [Caulobacteraceae bacterium]|jgi:predicted flap endonuclease-1-like 5' DNA nuclease